MAAKRPEKKNKLKLQITGIVNRWIISSLGLLIFIVLATEVLFAVVISSFYYDGMLSSLQQRAQNTASFFNSYLTNSYSVYYSNAYNFAETYGDKNIIELQFLNSRGMIEISTSGLMAGIKPSTEDISSALSSGKMSKWIGQDPDTGERVMAVSCPLIYSGKQVIGAVRYVSSMKLVDEQVFTLLAVIMLVGFGFIAFVVWSNMFFIRSIVDPVKEINNIAGRIAKGGYGAQIENEYRDEIGELCKTLNEMSLDIRNAEKMKNDFIASISHELRTPLTAISGWGETIMYTDDAAEMKQGISVIVNETKRLSNLVEDILAFTTMDNGQFKLTMEQLDIAAEFEEVVFVYMDTLRKQGILLEYDQDEDLPIITGDRERLKQVFYNIIDNAAKYGRDGKRITTEVRAEGDNVVIRVQDYGHGIPAEDLPYVKKKFYKGTSQSRGSGIGLAVSDEIITKHNGRLDISSELGKGTLVTITIPVRTRIKQ